MPGWKGKAVQFSVGNLRYLDIEDIDVAEMRPHIILKSFSQSRIRNVCENQAVIACISFCVDKRILIMKGERVSLAY
jgi:hypothetical protein